MDILSNKLVRLHTRKHGHLGCCPIKMHGTVLKMSKGRTDRPKDKEIKDNAPSLTPKR